jgi:hypothetical protein
MTSTQKTSTFITGKGTLNGTPRFAVMRLLSDSPVLRNKKHDLPSLAWGFSDILVLPSQIARMRSSKKSRLLHLEYDLIRWEISVGFPHTAKHACASTRTSWPLQNWVRMCLRPSLAAKRPVQPIHCIRIQRQQELSGFVANGQNAAYAYHGNDPIREKRSATRAVACTSTQVLHSS